MFEKQKLSYVNVAMSSPYGISSGSLTRERDQCSNDIARDRPGAYYLKVAPVTAKVSDLSRDVNTLIDSIIDQHAATWKELSRY